MDERAHTIAIFIAEEIESVLKKLNAQEKYISMIRVFQNSETNWCVEAPEKFSNHYKAPKLIIELDDGKNIIEQCAINGTRKGLISMGIEGRESEQL